jgi:MEDS: MEthanogen/methylotroph, DcmR Sensory domain
MRTEAARISLAGSTLGDTGHVCAFFHSDDEEYRVLLPFIKDGFDRGDKAIHVVNPGQRHDHLQRLATVGVDTPAAEKRGQFELRTNTDTYLRDGRFDQERMLAVFEQLASGNATHGFPLSRIVCRMDWVAEGRLAIDDVIEFESRINDIWRRHDDVVICTYHLHQFSGDAVIDIMRTHPMVIIGGILQRNPFFVPPEQFVQEFRERRSKHSARRATEV